MPPTPPHSPGHHHKKPHPHSPDHPPHHKHPHPPPHHEHPHPPPPHKHPHPPPHHEHPHPHPPPHHEHPHPPPPPPHKHPHPPPHHEHPHPPPPHGHPHPPPPHKHPHPEENDDGIEHDVGEDAVFDDGAAEEEKKDNEEDDIDIANLDLNDEEIYDDNENQDKGSETQAAAAASASDNDDNKKKQIKKNLFKTSEVYGKGIALGSTKFDHGNNRRINKLVVYADRHAIKGLEVTYNNQTLMSGSKNKNGKTFEMESGEFITHVLVRHGMVVQSLTFRTNKGRTLGPCGGKGWVGVLVKDREGQLAQVPAPFKRQLCGFSGSSSQLGYIDTICFRWGPAPTTTKK